MCSRPFNCHHTPAVIHGKTKSPEYAVCQVLSTILWQTWQWTCLPVWDCLQYYILIFKKSFIGKLPIMQGTHYRHLTHIRHRWHCVHPKIWISQLVGMIDISLWFWQDCPVSLRWLEDLPLVWWWQTYSKAQKAALACALLILSSHVLYAVRKYKKHVRNDAMIFHFSHVIWHSFFSIPIFFHLSVPS